MSKPPPPKKRRTMTDYFASSSKLPRETRDDSAMASAPENEQEPKTSAEDPTSIPESEPSDNDQDGNPSDEQSQVMELENDPRDPRTKPSPKREGSQAWRSTPMHILNKLADTGAPHGPLKPTETHKVMFLTPFTYDPNSTKPPKVFPNFLDKWDQYHVRMPCSNMNEYPVNNKILKRWDLIQRVLIDEIKSPQDFAEKVLEYNNQYYEKWDFKTFSSYFDVVASKEERQHFFSSEGTVRKIAHLALQLPHLCPTPIPLLKKGTNMSVTLSQQQIGCLLANAFFCTFPRRNSRKRSSEFFNYPTINFNTLLCGPPSVVRFEKLRCIFHYFYRFFKKMPLGTVTFTRQCIRDLPIWVEEKTTLRGLHVSSEGTIEDDGKGLLQVDFANMFLGGGVLGNGCVQEEIRFLICPEMMVSRLFTECLDKNECLIMTGCERFSDYTGYSSTFEWKEDYIDVTPRDTWGRIQCEVVAIDALVIYDHKSQFKMGSVMRELNKAYCGFASVDPNIMKLPAVCTGNWGCGAFGGDKQLKALIQLMAAAKAGRDLCYFTFDDVKLRDDIYELHKYLTSDNLLSINALLKIILDYGSTCVSGNKRLNVHQEIFEYVKLGLVRADLTLLVLDPPPMSGHEHSQHSGGHKNHSTGHWKSYHKERGHYPGHAHSYHGNKNSVSGDLSTNHGDQGKSSKGHNFKNDHTNHVKHDSYNVQNDAVPGRKTSDSHISAKLQSSSEGVSSCLNWDKNAKEDASKSSSHKNSAQGHPLGDV